MTGPTQGNQTQYSVLSGQWTYSVTFTLSDATLYQVKSHWSGKINILSEPQFQVSQSPYLTPPQYAVQAHILQIKWPQLGPLLIQSLIDAQYQWTNSAGQLSIVPGVQIAAKKFDALSFSFGLNIAAQPKPNGGVAFSVDPQPAASAWLTYSF